MKVGNIWDRTVTLDHVARFLEQATTPEIRQAMSNELIEQGYDEFYGHGSKTDWHQLVAEWLDRER